MGEYRHSLLTSLRKKKKKQLLRLLCLYWMRLETPKTHLSSSSPFSSLLPSPTSLPICSAIADQCTAGREDRAEEHHPGVEGALVPQQQPHRVWSQILWEGEAHCYITTRPRRSFSLLCVSDISIMDEHWQQSLKPFTDWLLPSAFSTPHKKSVKFFNNKVSHCFAKTLGLI